MIGVIIFAILFTVIIGCVYWVGINYLADDKCKECPYLYMYLPNEYMTVPMHCGSCEKDKDIKIVIIDKDLFAPYPDKAFIKYLQNMRANGWINIKGESLGPDKYKLTFKRKNVSPNK